MLIDLTTSACQDTGMSKRDVQGILFLIVWCMFWGTILAYAFMSLDLGR